MKRTNNKFRNNNYNNQIYSLNYKFDSNSIAGKVSGTALDLIKRYNELAKEAHTNNDYVSAEVFRQYAEHYRKIVTEINDKKNQNQNARNNNGQQPAADAAETPAENAVRPAEETVAAPAAEAPAEPVKTEAAADEKSEATAEVETEKKEAEKN